MDFDSRSFIAIAFSLIILIDSIVVLCKGKNKKYRLSGVISLFTAILFLAASAIGVVRYYGTSSDALLISEWGLYIAGLVIFIVALILRKKSASAKKQDSDK